MRIRHNFPTILESGKVSERERERESHVELDCHNFLMASIFAITLPHNICNFHTLCESLSAHQNPLAAELPPRHNIFQLQAPAGVLEIFLCPFYTL
jgi:hypothetical protein